MNNMYLAHHGIKGQKWGVRRFQNADGTLTEAGKKRVAKTEAYREKLASKSERNANYALARADDADKKVKDLNDNGRNSKVYRDWENRDRARKAAEYNSKTRDDETAPDYSDSWRKMEDDSKRYVNSRQKILELIDHYNGVASENRREADNWMKTHDDFMNMDVDAFTRKRSMWWKYMNNSWRD